MQSSTYVSRRPGPFADLLAVTDLGGFRMSPLAPLRVRDQYWDTADGELLRSGLSLRVRETAGSRTAALRPLAPEADLQRVADAVLPPDAPSVRAGAPVLSLPPGPLADALAERLGSDPLRPLLALRQYRTPRIAYDGARPALLVSLDVVVYEVPGAQVVSNEVEVEVTAQGRDADVERVDAALRGYDLEREPRTKLERGLLRLSRDLSEPLLLLPDERATVERIAERGDALLRRRARVLLLDARGYRADTVAAQTGLSAARVRHWKEQFLARRLGVFEPDAEPSRAYRVSELVEALPAEPASTDAVPDGPPRAAEAVSAAAAPSGPSHSEPAHAPASPPDVPAEPHVGPASPADPAEEAVTAEIPTGDGALDASAGDLDGLLDQFTPTQTATPFLDSDDAFDEEAGGWDDESDEEDDAANPEPSAALEVVMPSEAQNSNPSSAEARSPEAPLRAPDLRADTPLVDAAFAALVYHVARFERAASRLAGDLSQDGSAPDGAGDARRVLLAAHRVRLAADAFRPYVPAMAAGRLVAALRPLVAALDDALDQDRAAAAPGADAARHTEARDRALARARDLLRGGRHRAWGPRARRLLDRLGAQHDAGLLIGDDFPAPPDDLVGEPGDVPAPSRLRHAAASMLWARYEAVRAFEDDVARGSAPSAETVYHLALAVSGLHFVLGLVAFAPSAPVRTLAARLDAAEARLAAYRTARRTADLVGTAIPASADVADVRDDLVSADFRHALADVAARV
ncbi:MAG TPA: CYTH domain-containing protein [Rubricoccaceae bacterium]|jgi:hypothetical protein